VTNAVPGYGVSWRLFILNALEKWRWNRRRSPGKMPLPHEAPLRFALSTTVATDALGRTASRPAITGYSHSRRKFSAASLDGAATIGALEPAELLRNPASCSDKASAMPPPAIALSLSEDSRFFLNTFSP
jgi:hypothetical protein